MIVEYKCIRCGSDDFEEGAVQSSGTISFRPKATKFLQLVPGNMTINSRICMTCGFIELTGEVEKVESLTKRTEKAYKV
ncbi:hypothetical protein IIC38_14180 [candidate division KSB1 bacterium]|nr:hypothetical protein [candidate division KSB1 bacterium]